MVIFRKKQVQNHPSESLSNIQVEGESYQKRLGITLDEKLNFKKHIDSAISIVLLTDCGDMKMNIFCEKLESV